MKTQSTHTVAVEVDSTDVVTNTMSSGVTPFDPKLRQFVRFTATSNKSIEDAEQKMNDFLDRILAAREES